MQNNEVPPNSFQLRRAAIRALERCEFRDAASCIVLAKEAKVKEAEYDAAFARNQFIRTFGGNNEKATENYS